MVKQLAVSLSLTSLKLAAVLGDDIFPQIDRYLTFPLMETGQKLETLQPVLISANAYLGAQGIVQALQGGADVVNAIRDGLEQDSGMKPNTSSAMKPNSFRPIPERCSASPE